ncbi:PA2169 family four-helix-bundle protein [Pigmentiphaga soli]|uniref:PA2169 family four-helix-bundle protein n=1 Tax=Pigmentiphaga soli TaxID=1007095 RepID=A0ABP8GMH1_9BURK
MAKSIVTVLNELIEISKDGEKGFRKAAEDATHPELRALLSRRAGDCATGAAQLQQQVAALGGEPEESGSTAGALHRGWVSVKAAVAGRTDLAILEECERGEDVAKARYQAALDEELPPQIRALVQLQYEGVVRNHDQIRTLRDRMREYA